MGRAYGRPLSFNYCTSSLDGVTPANNSNAANNPGVAWTAGNTDADGAAVSVLSALPHDVHLLRIQLAGINGSAVDSNAIGDLLGDPAGGTSWGAIINDLSAGFTPVVNSAGLQITYWFPLYIKAGTSIGWRGRTHHTADLTTGRIIVDAFGDPSRPGQWWSGTVVETLGASPSTSQGTTVTPGNSGAFGSWTNIGGATTYRYGAVQIGIGGANGTLTNAGYLYQLGFDSARVPGYPPLWFNYTGTETVFHAGMAGLGLCDIPAGKTLQLRGTQNASATTHPNFILYGVA
jgi:hypothetical protein